MNKAQTSAYNKGQDEEILKSGSNNKMSNKRKIVKNVETSSFPYYSIRQNTRFQTFKQSNQ